MKLRLLLVLSLAVWAAPAARMSVPADAQTVLDQISAEHLRGHLSFLASDLLEGRDTPSRGLDLAAEYVAAEFRSAGLKPPVNDTYFQPADFVEVTRSVEKSSVTIEADGKPIVVDPEHIRATPLEAVSLSHMPLFKIEDPQKATDEIAGKAAFVKGRGGRGGFDQMLRHHPAAVVLVSEFERPSGNSTRLMSADDYKKQQVPLFSISNKDVMKLYEGLPAGLTRATVSLHAAAGTAKPVMLRNVIGVLPGSDPALREQYVLVTAHYDHIGLAKEGTDRIFNGANDDGSGTVSVIELASAMASIHPHPRRSIAFITFFGEEKGLLGSRYYAQHPVFPLAKTVAQVNLEQLGRTDEKGGAEIGTFTLTGFNFTNLPEIFKAAGQAIGVKVRDSKDSDAFFARSDNQALADAGIPANTLAVAYEFGDYHQVGDEWQKIDYENMAKVDRAIGLGVLTMADDDHPPHWNEANAKTKKYVDAFHSLHP